MRNDDESDKSLSTQPTPPPSSILRSASWRPSELHTMMSTRRASSGTAASSLQGVGTPVDSSNSGSGNGSDTDESDDEDLAMRRVLEKTERAARHHVVQGEHTAWAAFVRRFDTVLMNENARRVRQRSKAVDDELKRPKLPEGPQVSAEVLRAFPWKTPLSRIVSILKAEAKVAAEEGAEAEKGNNSKHRAVGIRERLKMLRLVSEDSDQLSRPLVTGTSDSADPASTTPEPRRRRVRINKTLQVVPIPARRDPSELEGASPPYDSDDLEGRRRPHDTGSSNGHERADESFEFEPYESEVPPASSSSDDEPAPAATSRTKRRKSSVTHRQRVANLSNRLYNAGRGTRSSRREQRKQMLKDAPLRPLRNEPALLFRALATNTGGTKEGDPVDMDDVDEGVGDKPSSSGGALQTMLDGMTALGHADEDGSPSASRSQSMDYGAIPVPFAYHGHLGLTETSPDDINGGGRRLTGRSMPYSPSSSFAGQSYRHRPGESPARSHRTASPALPVVAQSGSVCFGRGTQSPRAAELDEQAAARQREVDEHLANAPRYQLRRGTFRVDTAAYDREMAWLASVKSRRGEREVARVARIGASQTARDSRDLPVSVQTAVDAKDKPQDAAPKRKAIPVPTPKFNPPVFLRRRPADMGNTDRLFEATMREAEENGHFVEPQAVDGQRSVSSSDETVSTSVPAANADGERDSNSLLDSGGYMWHPAPPPQPRAWRAFLHPGGVDSRRIGTANDSVAPGSRWREAGHEHRVNKPRALTKNELVPRDPISFLSPASAVGELEGNQRSMPLQSTSSNDDTKTSVPLPLIPSAVVSRPKPQTTRVSRCVDDVLAPRESRSQGVASVDTSPSFRSGNAPKQSSHRAAATSPRRPGGTTSGGGAADEGRRERRQLLAALEALVSEAEADHTESQNHPSRSPHGASSSTVHCPDERGEPNAISARAPNKLTSGSTSLAVASPSSPSAQKNASRALARSRRFASETVAAREAASRRRQPHHVLGHGDMAADEVLKRGAARVFGVA